MSFASKKHFAGQHIALTVEAPGFTETAFIKVAEGGMIKAATVEEPNAGYNLRERHTGVREVEPLSLEFGMAGSKWAPTLMEQIVDSQLHNKFSGQIIHADTNFEGQYTYQFLNALVTEFSLPKLDAKSKEYAFLKMKVQPEAIDFNIAKSPKLPPANSSRQKHWMSSAFRLTIGKEDVDASSIEALSVKVGAKAYQTGGFMLPQYTPTGKLEMPKLSFTVPMGGCAALVRWFREAVCKENTAEDAAGYEKDAMIEFLDSTRSKVLYTVDLMRCGPETFSLIKGDDATTRAMKFDCYVTSMKLTPSGEGLI